MECENQRSVELQALETGVLKLWDDLAHAKTNAKNTNGLNNLLFKVDELAMLVMEMNDVEQKCMECCSSLEIIEIKPQMCPQLPVAELPPLPAQTPSNVEDYPDAMVFIAALFVVYIAFQMIRFIFGFISEIFRSPC